MAQAIRYVALLRGINVGKAKRVAMADLRRIVGELGFTEVRTLLNSGNVIFTGTSADAKTAARRIEAAVLDQLGVASRVTVASAEEVAVIVDGNSLLAVAADHSRMLVGVLYETTDLERLAPLAGEDWAPDAFAAAAPGGRAAYLWCPSGLLDGRLAIAFGRILRDGVTTRNWATFLKIHAMLTE